MKGQEIRIFLGTIEQFLNFWVHNKYQVGWILPKKSSADFLTGNDELLYFQCSGYTQMSSDNICLLIFSQVGFGLELRSCM